MTVALVHDPGMSAYDLGPSHPLRPERFTLAVELMRELDLLAESPEQAMHAGAAGSRALVVRPAPASDDDIELVHTREYVTAVQEASAEPASFRPRMGIGPGDTPAFAGMHEASALICGGTCCAVDGVLDGTFTRAFNVAGGLHHAQSDHASGFCVYNDPAVAIARATRDNPGLRVAYIDIDAHHGDGVEAAFESRDDVLTVSVHESGLYLFPGTGFAVDIGHGEGTGTVVNIPLPPGADDACYELVVEQAIVPAVTAYAPDLIVAQCGADGHRDDPLTHLGLSVAGHQAAVRRLVRLADDVCGGKIAATGGGGYDAFSAVPRAWTCTLAELLGVTLPEPLPDAWQEMVAHLGQQPVPRSLHEEHTTNLPSQVRVELLAETERVIARVKQLSPLLAE